MEFSEPGKAKPLFPPIDTGCRQGQPDPDTPGYGGILMSNGGPLVQWGRDDLTDAEKAKLVTLGFPEQSIGPIKPAPADHFFAQEIEQVKNRVIDSCQIPTHLFVGADFGSAKGDKTYFSLLHSPPNGPIKVLQQFELPQGEQHAGNG